MILGYLAVGQHIEKRFKLIEELPSHVYTLIFETFALQPFYHRGFTFHLTKKPLLRGNVLYEVLDNRSIRWIESNFDSSD